MKVRYLIKFTKEADIKFVAHLDLMRTIQRVIRRSGLPVDYSKGFNPHMSLSIAQPLSVGVYSEGEYMDVVFKEEVDPKEIVERLNKSTASGVRFLSAVGIEVIENVKKLPQAMALIDAARYTIKMHYTDTSNFEDEMKTLLSREDWVMTKRSKKGVRDVDIKPLVHELKYWIKDNEVVLNVLISSGSREHLAPDLLVKLIKENTTNCDEEAFVQVKREEMYFMKDDTLVPLYKCV
ncbi:radical SAM-linked protein [Clostridium sardiniense]|nr:TIGR03936 family radical SAM-associated protein [Clostridium sardiniense]MBM7836142.1 radical SAM-linked protein [Clostridium sardiniense]